MGTHRAAVGAIALAVAVGAIAAVAVFAPDAPDSDGPRATAVSSTRTREAPAESARTPGWRVVGDPEAGVTYEVPPGWVLAEEAESLESSNGVLLRHLADFGTYACQGAEYGSAFSGSGLGRGEPAEAAAELAAAIAADQYSDGTQTARVTLSAPTAVERDGARGAVVSAEAETAAQDGDPCAGTAGTVTVVALTTGAGTALVVLGADTRPGEADAVELARAEDLRAVIDSVRPRR